MRLANYPAIRTTTGYPAISSLVSHCSCCLLSDARFCLPPPAPVYRYVRTHTYVYIREILLLRSFLRDVNSSLWLFLPPSLQSLLIFSQRLFRVTHRFASNSPSETPSEITLASFFFLIFPSFRPSPCRHHRRFTLPD